MASQLGAKIVRQIEYYFGDQNLARDKFLLQKISEDNGWVTLECLTTFNRLKALTTDHNAIIEALKEGGTGLIEIHDDNTKLRRREDKPLPDPNDPVNKKSMHEKTVYVKGFPQDATLDEIEDFCLQHGKVAFIKMRRDADRKFKGSAFVEFANVEDAQRLCQAEEIKYKEAPLIRMSRDAYFREKNAEVKKQKGSNVSKTEEETEKKAKQEEEPFESGCVMHFSGCGEGVSREDLKALFGEKEEVQWVDFNRNDTEGYLRFKSEGGAERAIKAVKAENEGKVVLNDAELTCRVLEGDEESQYWKKIREASRTVRERKRANRANDRGRNKKGRFQFRHDRKRPKEGDKNSRITFDSGDESSQEPGTKRKAEENGASTSPKQAKVED